MSSPRQFVIILAGGSGTRFGGASLPKQLVDLAGAPLFTHCVETYRGIEEIERMLLVVNPEHVDRFTDVLRKRGRADEMTIVSGGATRQASIANGMKAIDADDGVVVLHNAASPLTSASLIRECLAQARRHDAVQAFCPAHHTIFERADDGLDVLLDRDRLGYTSDPTVYRLSLLRRILAEQESRGGFSRETTLSVARELGIPVKLVESSRNNIKVTLRCDLAAAEALMRERG